MTNLEHAEKWADAQPARFREMHRMTPIEPWELPTITRQVAEERADSKRFADSQANSAEGCADTSDDEASGPVGILDTLLWWAKPVAFVAGFLACVAVVIAWRAQ